MDAVIFVIVTLILAWRVMEGTTTEPTKSNVKFKTEDTTTRVAKLNENFYDDPDAFMDIARALGFPKESK